MTSLTDRLINENLAALTPYESARRLFTGGQDWLNANESPFANDYAIDSAKLNRYPDCQPPELIARYAGYAGVARSEVIATRGADEGIELLIRTFCKPGRDRILICPPTYGMYAISAQTNDVSVTSVSLNTDFSLDVDAICRHDNVNLVFVCSPNNPTGTRVDETAIASLLEHFRDKALVVVDEAYIEYDAHSTWAGKLADYPNLVILRTLSKAFALAGLRCGFTLANPPVINALMKAIAPYPIPDPVAQIAAQALSEEGLSTLRGQVAWTNNAKAALTRALSERTGIEIVGDQQANFVLFRFAQRAALMQFLVENGMLIRDQSKQRGLENCLRATVGNDAQNARLLSLIDSFLARDGDPQ